MRKKQLKFLLAIIGFILGMMVPFIIAWYAYGTFNLSCAIAPVRGWIMFYALACGVVTGLILSSLDKKLLE